MRNAPGRNGSCGGTAPGRYAPYGACDWRGGAMEYGSTMAGRRLRWRRAWTLRLLVLAALLAAVTFVAAANYVLVDLRLPGWQGDVRLSWIVLGATAIGIGAGLLLVRIGRWLI